MQVLLDLSRSCHSSSSSSSFTFGTQRKSWIFSLPLFLTGVVLYSSFLHVLLVHNPRGENLCSGSASGATTAMRRVREQEAELPSDFLGFNVHNQSWTATRARLMMSSLLSTEPCQLSWVWCQPRQEIKRTPRNKPWALVGHSSQTRLCPT